MSFFTDKKYAGFISSRLEGFTWERPNLGRARCPFCGDSSKKESKRRFYVYQSSRPGANHDQMSCYCHNCNYAKPFGAFLKEFDEFRYNEYRMETFQENSAWKQFIDTKATKAKEPAKPAFALSEAEQKVWTRPPYATTVASLPDDHFAKQYVVGRQIKQTDLLWFTDDFYRTIKNFCGEERAKKCKYNEPRLLIPFFNEKGEIETIQGRSFDPEDSIRYLTFKLHAGSSKVFGLERVNKQRTVLVVEGPIDSLFLPNCVATADSNLLNVDWGDLYIYDFQPRNEQIVKGLKKAIDMGKRVVIPPDNFPWKDLNDCIVKGKMTKTELLQFLAKHAVQGPAAALRWAGYKRD